MTNNKTEYIVVDAPGYYSNQANVYSSHRTLAAACKAAHGYKNLAVYRGDETKGNRVSCIDLNHRDVLTHDA